MLIICTPFLKQLYKPSDDYIVHPQRTNHQNGIWNIPKSAIFFIKRRIKPTAHNYNKNNNDRGKNRTQNDASNVSEHNTPSIAYEVVSLYYAIDNRSYKQADCIELYFLSNNVDFNERRNGMFSYWSDCMASQLTPSGCASIVCVSITSSGVIIQSKGVSCATIITRSSS